MLFDVHMHTEFSTDSEMKIQEAITISKNLNLGITITEHLDLDFPGENFFKVDIQKYLEAYTPYRNSYLLIGIEMGLSTFTFEENTKIYELYKNHLDFVIGSLHSLYEKDLYTVLTKNKNHPSKKELYEDYLVNMLNCVKIYDCFDSLGHIDYICRYAPFEDKELHYHEFSDYVDEIFKTIISKDKVIELNTARLNDSSAVNNLLKLYTRYKELGGKFITLGSDSHNEAQIGRNFNEAKFILEKTGLKAVHFKERNIIVDTI